jgi:hypothetical protein
MVEWSRASNQKRRGRDIDKVMKEQKVKIDYMVGTMIELLAPPPLTR